MLRRLRGRDGTDRTRPQPQSPPSTSLSPYRRFASSGSRTAPSLAQIPTSTRAHLDRPERFVQSPHHRFRHRRSADATRRDLGDELQEYARTELVVGISLGVARHHTERHSAPYLVQAPWLVLEMLRQPAVEPQRKMFCETHFQVVRTKAGWPAPSEIG